MYITDSKTIDDWRAIREKLHHSSDELIWRKAFIDFFWGRIDSRYLNPIKQIREKDFYLGYGFSMLTILCSLVEFLESTYKGEKYRFCRDAELEEFEYNKSKKCFVDFLTTKNPFSARFNEDSAIDFYSSVRCGLLHEASTKNGWKVWGRSETGKVIVCVETKKVYRDDFELAVKEYIRNYGDELVSSKELQNAFIRKFDWLCE